MFYLRLAHIRGVSVKELLRTSDSRELAEEMAFYLIEPYGHECLGRAMGAAASLNAMGAKVKPVDLLPVRPPVRKQSPDKMARMFRAMAAEHNKSCQAKR